MSARIIYVTDEEFELIVSHLPFGSTASESITLNHKIVFMRDKHHKITYEQGFRDGMSCNHKEPQTFSFMGYKMEDLIKIIKEHQKIEIMVLFETTSIDGGKIKLETWPEGLVLWVNGRIKYKYWEDDEK